MSYPRRIGRGLSESGALCAVLIPRSTEENALQVKCSRPLLNRLRFSEIGNICRSTAKRDGSFLMKLGNVD
ncbi:hypothetical protein OESDEN_01996 [Oesophagostomum dentatum]|uniref:Uncharacterized protein n=1 Tax=Oesophagostomum dentatum TaxID=61180 RepID=A0A0B1TQD5_OESDE|nr:hypothetical protein OESDEN_01996 [Oesophagostomum dentatum]